MNTTNEMLTEEVKWSMAKKFFFFFVLGYSFLYIFPFPVNMIPGGDYAIGWYSKVINAAVGFVGGKILHIPNLVIDEENGSGDTSAYYVWLLTTVALAFVFAIAATLIGRKKANYSKLYYLLFTYVRYYVAIFMIIYGFSKVFKSQFGFPTLTILEERYGNSSPMGLLWNFMGYSTPYTVFAGMGEVLGGALLLFRRTLVVGALLSLFVMVNVVALNFCYDVPVKLFSLHLVLFSLFLLGPNISNLTGFMFRKKEAALHSSAMPYTKKWLKVSRIILKVAVFLLVGFQGYTCYANMAQYGDSAPKPPMYGIYKTQLFIRNRDTLKPMTTDTVRWNRLIVDQYYARVDLMTEAAMYFQANADTVHKTISLQSTQDSTLSSKFTYTMKNDTLVMHGVLKKDTLTVQFKKFDYRNFMLVNRGFHWVNEYPFNR